MFGVDAPSSSQEPVPEALESDSKEVDEAEPDMKDLVVKDDIDEPVAAVETATKDDVETKVIPVPAVDHIDNEDSLNLTIGEDEEKLLQGEVSVGHSRIGRHV